jgi:membrane-associated phospholipid phosphatase
VLNDRRQGAIGNAAASMTGGPIYSVNRLFGLSAVLFVAGWVALSCDLYVAEFCAQDRMPHDIRKLFGLSEMFAHGIGVVLIGLTVVVLDPANRRKVPRVLSCAFGAGILADVIKLLVGRTRPNHLDNLPSHVSDTFFGWIPWLTLADGNAAWDHGIQSFPSGHAATAVGLAIGLTWLYPRGRWLFAVFAVLAALQRIDTNAHFVSDTLGGAAAGCVVAAVCIDTRAIGRWFVRWESSATEENHRL